MVGIVGFPGTNDCESDRGRSALLANGVKMKKVTMAVLREAMPKNANEGPKGLR
jgi:hypothetical protein